MLRLFTALAAVAWPTLPVLLLQRETVVVSRVDGGADAEPPSARSAEHKVEPPRRTRAEQRAERRASTAGERRVIWALRQAWRPFTHDDYWFHAHVYDELCMYPSPLAGTAFRIVRAGPGLAAAAPVRALAGVAEPRATYVVPYTAIDGPAGVLHNYAPASAEFCALLERYRVDDDDDDDEG